MRTKICGLFLLTSGSNTVDESVDYNRHCQSETECTDNEAPVINTYTQHTSVHLFVLYHGDKHSHFLLQNVDVCQVVLATPKKVIKGTGRYSSSWEPNLRATRRQLPYGITQCYLPPDTSERASPNPSHAGCYLIYLSQRDGRLSWPSWLDCTPATFRSRVWPQTAAPPRQPFINIKSPNSRIIVRYSMQVILT